MPSLNANAPFIYRVIANFERGGLWYLCDPLKHERGGFLNKIPGNSTYESEIFLINFFYFAEVRSMYCFGVR